jgi:hypothetical protein
MEQARAGDPIERLQDGRLALVTPSEFWFEPGPEDLHGALPAIGRPHLVELGIFQDLEAPYQLELLHPATDLEGGYNLAGPLRVGWNEHLRVHEPLKHRIRIDQRLLGVNLTCLAKTNHGLDDRSRGAKLLEKFRGLSVDDSRRGPRPRPCDGEIPILTLELIPYLRVKFLDRDYEYISRQY